MRVQVIDEARTAFPERFTRFKTVCAALLAILYTVVAIAIVASSGVESLFILLPVIAAFCLAMCWMLGMSL